MSEPQVIKAKEIRASGERIIVEDLAGKREQTEGGIALPKGVKEREYRLCRVVSMGGKAKVAEFPVCAEDDVVMIDAFAGKEFEISGRTMLFLNERDVLGVVELSDEQ